MSILVETFEPLSLALSHVSRKDGDSNDKLNYKYTAMFFAVLGAVVMLRQVVGDPIRCWTPAEFSEAWVEYTNSLCWTSKKTYVPLNETNVLKEEKRSSIMYYQWVPLSLFLQALLFYAPSMLWRMSGRAFGFEGHKVIQALGESDGINPSMRDKWVRYVVRNMDRTLAAYRHVTATASGCCPWLRQRLASMGCLCGKRHGNVVIILFMLIKFLYICNVVLQFYALYLLFAPKINFFAYGIEVVQDLMAGKEPVDSPKFPKVVLCEFDIRNIGRHRPYTIQCVLTMNEFNCKIYMVVWFWLVMVGVTNVVNFASWLVAMLPDQRRRLIKKKLKLFGRYERQQDAKMVRSFCNHYLRGDGFFLVRLLGKNTNEVVMGELIAELWDNYTRNYTVDFKGAIV